MSRETAVWLNTNTLIGFTSKRGRAWHHRAELQGEESNHYPDAIPVEDVRRRLFGWRAVEGSIQATVMGPDGVLTVTDPERKAIVRPDTGAILGVFKQGYKIHQFDNWLLDNVATILDDDLAIGSAGLLRGGALAWVSVEVPETITTPEGVEFRPHLLAAAAHDGSMSTTYQRVVTNVVCDNTMSAALREKGQRIKVRHSANSLRRLTETRQALAIVHTISRDFAAQVAELTSVKVTGGEWQRFLDSLVPLGEKEGRSRTMAENKRDTLQRLYTHDVRVAPWAGTAWGVVQAVNTMVHHESIVRGVSRAERNTERAVTGGVDKLDRDTLDRLNAVII